MGRLAARRGPALWPAGQLQGQVTLAESARAGGVTRPTAKMTAASSARAAVKAGTLIALSNGVSRGMRSACINMARSITARYPNRGLDGVLVNCLPKPPQQSSPRKPALRFGHINSRCGGVFMSSNGPIWVSDLNETTERETRIRQALLRRAVENLRSNRAVVPLFGLAICGMFPQW